ncbi:MAG: alanine--tRNA ligase [Candidatus Nealsonbacteria bacterium CG08_land_8_20_14_0_20_43_11]|uniref:alanine--tRNA ligase n=1 Tax=Candidatus Nealsonbacteria bacterium CG08_land_8_20_14_0_20_43_11 TaxID=1974706 RepID=A0A2M6T0D2_9BACT|nr:MAG: alanine--tRNA ligase [Candidatus Nealsonbacteria bacterium CG08_land_8_20_14_0_20_43_11]
MDSFTLRKKFLDFFEKQGHVIVASSSLLPTDPSVLFTTAGMQQFKPYYLGEESPFGRNTVSCQKCFRTSDIEEVGDRRHLTFFEMLGNFSFGGYFKKEAIEMALEFFVSECGFPFERLYFTYFQGDREVPEDTDSKNICLRLGVPESRIFGSNRKDNFWGPTGEEGSCGPTVEIYYDLTGIPCANGKNCTPVSCDCGRFIELWNLVFNEFFQDKNKKLTPLKLKGVDTGMGLERLAFVSQGKGNVFESDLSAPLMKIIQHQEQNDLAPGEKERLERIIADHTKGAVFLISEGILPSNVERGYILRRIIRRAIRYGKLINPSKNFLVSLAQKTIEIYRDVYPEVKSKETDILAVIQNEEEKFEKALDMGQKKLDFALTPSVQKVGDLEITPGIIITENLIDLFFNIYQSFAMPLDMIFEELDRRGLDYNKEKIQKGFEERFKKHQEISRAGAEKKFGGLGKDATSEMIKLHTATHLLHQALRMVLGEHVRQMGSDITPQRLRFDFSHSLKMTDPEIKQVEEIVNKKIKEDLAMERKKMSYQEAVKAGALAFFSQRYPEKVSVYSVLELSGKPFSREICAGPHVKRTGELGEFKIEKEESSGAGVRRVRAVLKPR